MAETAYQRYKKDTEDQEPKTIEGEFRNLNDFQKSFLGALESIGEPKKPVRYLKPFNPFQKEDNSLARFILKGSPNMKIILDKYMSKKHNKKVDSIQLLKDGDQKDYISIIDEVSKGVDSGAFDFASGVKELLFASSDYVFDTKFLEAFDEMMKDPEKQPDRPETWRGDLVALMTQFAIPGGVLQKVLRGTKTVGQINKIINGIKGAKTQKVSKIAARAIEGATVVGAVDFLASEPGRKSFFFEPESTEGLTGKERAAASFRNKVKYGQEGALVGFGFPLLGKGAQLGYKIWTCTIYKTNCKIWS